MKIRTDFVTNSSSSSYIIARRKDFKKADMLKFLMDNPDWYEKLIANKLKYWSYYYKSKEDVVNKIGNLEICADNIVDDIYDMGDMELDDYWISTITVNSEDMDTFGEFIEISPTNDSFKVQCVYD